MRGILIVISTLFYSLLFCKGTTVVKKRGAAGTGARQTKENTIHPRFAILPSCLVLFCSVILRTWSSIYRSVMLYCRWYLYNLFVLYCLKRCQTGQHVRVFPGKAFLSRRIFYFYFIYAIQQALNEWTWQVT